MSIARFYGLHAGERCAILANGESLLDFPESRKYHVKEIARWFHLPPDLIGDLEKATVPYKDWPDPIIGLNRSWELVDAPYHCIIDLKQLESARKECVTFEHLFIGQGKDEKQEAKKLKALKHIKAETVTFLPGHESRYGLGFCTDLVNDTFFIPSVPYMALQIANWMGFAEIHFWGLDLHGGKFWKPDWKIVAGTAKQQDREFKLANRKLKALGVRVVNHSKGTLCTAFERG